jgi:hypothetical protein
MKNKPYKALWDAISMLYIHDILTEGERLKATRRVLKLTAKVIAEAEANSR